MIIEAAKFAIDVLGVGLLEELAVDFRKKLDELLELPALIWAVFAAMLGG